MDAVAINTTLNLEDWHALQAQCPARFRVGESPRAQWARIAVMAATMGVVVFLTAGLSPLSAFRLDAGSVLAGVAVVAVSIWVNAWLARRNSSPDEKGAFLGSCVYELDGAGLRSTRERVAGSFAAWAAVRDVTFTATHVFLWVDRFAAFTIPGRDLPHGFTTQQLFDWIAATRAQAATHTASPEPSVTTLPPSLAAPDAGPARRGRGAWLLDLASFIALRGKAVLTEPNLGVPATFTTLLAIGTWLAFNRWETGSDAEFFVYGMSDVAWFLLGGLAVAWVLSRASSPRIALPRAIVVCSLGAWLMILYSYLSVFVESRWLAIALAVAVLLYIPAYFSRAARALTGQRQLRAGIAAFLAAIAFSWTTQALWVYPTAWVADDYGDEEEDADAYENIEPLLFAQRDRIDTALATVADNDPNADELFFVGFAGVGEQKVFAEEIKFAARTVAERYSNVAGSVLLLNDVRDLYAAPFATKTTLRYAVEGVAAKMDLDDDILVVALSSHGSSEWALSVTNGVLPLADVTPEELRATLHYAGIKWRVIVISSCYAGGFIDALQDPYTIVLAAASPDRTSFGCSNERDLTYFGEAFYRDALPNAASLREAFATAEQRVLEREAAEGIDMPSQPVAFFGAELERKLAALE